MSWLKTTIQFGSLFSYRVPDFSSQYALSSLLPSPLSVKLGLVSTAIQYKGIKFGEKVFELIKNREVGFKVKGRIVVNNFLIKRLKAGKGKEANLQSTFGIRGYVFYEAPLEIWVKAVDKELLQTMKRLRYLGTSDSLCTVIRVDKTNNNKNLIAPRQELNSVLLNSMVVPTKDLHKDDTFDDINIYNFNKRQKPKLEKKFFQVPIKNINQSKNWIIYEIGK